ncbi:hypothetical protein [Terricaulis sp.]|uniref:hypothetical protein n=1 Tax=Terricaulis sp. TaxID=2768686 RepID=UPI002AC49EA4|nr:hypothetical protein [Terricaulis sp.]MDZ4690560.1 hypothetical protein [Terricaulis sp.]
MARGVFTLAALLAVFLQAFVIEPHVHSANPMAAAIAASSVHQERHQQASLSHEQTACLVCQALAANGGALLQANATVTAPAFFAATATPRVLHVAPRAVAHSWRSRAPPIEL